MLLHFREVGWGTLAKDITAYAKRSLDRIARNFHPVSGVVIAEAIYLTPEDIDSLRGGNQGDEEQEWRPFFFFLKMTPI